MSNILKKYEKMSDEQLNDLFKSLDERKDINWAYIAGWIDGDGFIGKLNSSGNCGVMLKIADKEPVEMLSELFKTTLSQEKMDPRPIFVKPPKRRYYTTISSKKAIYLAKKIAPFIMEKTKNLYKTLQSYGCNEKFQYMELNDEDFINYLVGFSEAEGSFECNLKTKKFSYIISNTNLNLLKYLERRLKQLGFFNVKMAQIFKKGIYFFNKNATNKMVHRKNSYTLRIQGYALLDFYNLIKDKLVIERKKQKVLDTIEYFKNYRGQAYRNYIKEKAAL